MDIFSRIMRWLFAIGSFGVSFYVIGKTAAGTTSITGAFLPILGAIGLLFFGAVLITPDVLAIATKPFTAFIDSVFFPGGKLSKPTLSYALPDYYRKMRRFEEALAEFRKILRYYPRQARAYLGAIELLAREFDEKEKAKELYNIARRKLRDRPDDLMLIENCWIRLSNELLIR